MEDPPPKWLKNWKGDGILVHVGNRRVAAAALEAGVPAVAFRWAVTTPGIPAIGTDHRAVATAEILIPPRAVVTRHSTDVFALPSHGLPVLKFFWGQAL